MPQDDHAMFGYGITFDKKDEELAYNILESVGSEFDIQHISGHIFLHYESYTMRVDPQMGDFWEERKEGFYPPMARIEYDGVKYPLKFYLHMW